MTIIYNYDKIKRKSYLSMVRYDYANHNSDIYKRFDNVKKVRLNLKNRISFGSHRSGWKYAMDSLYSIRNDDYGILVDDFIERTFSWGRPPIGEKTVSLNEKIWKVDYDDLRKCPAPKNTGMTHCVKVENNLVIRWCQTDLKWESYNITDDQYSKLELAYDPPIYYSVPWIGFWHNPPDIRGYVASHDLIHAPHYLFLRREFLSSLRFCKGMFVFSETMAIWVRQQFKSLNLNIPVSMLYHPTEEVDSNNMFSMTKFINNNNKKILQIGSWLRDVTALFELKTFYKKLWVCGDKDALLRFCDDIELIKDSVFFGTIKIIKKIIDAGYEQNKEYLLTHDVYLVKLSDDNYDRVLSKNIVLTKIKASSCNNGIIECIIRGTPIFVNKLDAVIEYLGNDYPLYYNNYNDIEKILSSPNLNKIIKNTNDYLINECSTRIKLSGDYFRNDLINSKVIHDLVNNRTNCKINNFIGKNCFNFNIEDKNKIDFVVTWVSSESEMWVTTRNTDLKNVVCDFNDGNSENRYRNLYDELKYCLRSINSACGDIVNNLYLVVHDNQELPRWLNIKEKSLKIVRHSEIFSNKKPSYNSSAIETRLHKIKGLTNNFVYLNDDVFLLGRWTRDDFIDNDKTISYVSNKELGKSNICNSSFEYLWKNNHIEINKMFPNHKNEFKPTMDHAPFSLNKKILKKLGKSSTVKLTEKSLVRSKKDVGLINGIYHYYCLYKDKCKFKNVKIAYLTPNEISKNKLCAIKPEIKVLSLQDDTNNQINDQIIYDVIDTFDKLFEIPSIYETIC